MLDSPILAECRKLSILQELGATIRVDGFWDGEVSDEIHCIFNDLACLGSVSTRVNVWVSRVLVY